MMDKNSDNSQKSKEMWDGQEELTNLRLYLLELEEEIERLTELIQEKNQEKCDKEIELEEIQDKINQLVNQQSLYEEEELEGLEEDLHDG